MRRKERGFSIIEIILVLGVVGILSSFVVPKTREYLALAKDTKAINILQSVRVASESYYLETGEYPYSAGDSLATALPKISKYIRDNNLKATGDKVIIDVGGSKSSKESKDIRYGGKVEMYIDNNEILLKPIENTQNFSIRGEEWSKL